MANAAFPFVSHSFAASGHPHTCTHTHKLTHTTFVLPLVLFICVANKSLERQQIEFLYDVPFAVCRCANHSSLMHTGGHLNSNRFESEHEENVIQLIIHLFIYNLESKINFNLKFISHRNSL